MATKRTARTSGEARVSGKEIVTTSRIEAFSDAVFAIAATLLVLQLDVPHFLGNPTDAQLWNALGQTIPSYFSLVLSFAVIGRYWVAHHWQFSRIAKSDAGLLTINLGLLLTVVALPFPTEILGDYGNLPAATIFYAVSISLIGLMMAAVWHHAVKNKLLKPGVTQATIQNSYIRSLSVPVIFLASVPVAAWVSVTLAQLMWVSIFFVGLALRK